ncbi:MAG: hypothetical protein RSD95_07790 [Clostridia bacterium]
MRGQGEMTVDYIYNHHWGLFIDGALEQEYETFDEAMDAYELRGGA